MKKFLMFSGIILITQFYALAQIATYVVIAEVYGGGGEQGSYWTNDYIILYNQHQVRLIYLPGQFNMLFSIVQPGRLQI